MIVDDEESIRSTMQIVLNAAGYETLTVSTGRECLERVVEEQPDIILLDVQMPELDGFAVASRLTAEEQSRAIPIVMVSGGLNEADRIRGLQAGAVEFLSKPAETNELLSKVRSLARLKSYHDETRAQREALVAEVSGKEGQLRDALTAFARFVPREFLSCLSRKSVLEVSLGDQVQAEMAVMFADIRDFTLLSDSMSPEQNFSFLNAYLGRMNPFIWENGGYIDKYIGDAIMALFPSGTEGALDAAVAMLEHIPTYNAQRARSGYSPIRIGIGIHSGRVMLGIIGHERFLQGTVISDTVNLASRLEGLTKEYGVSLVVSNEVLFSLQNPNRYRYRFLDKVTVRGKREAVPVYEVFDSDPPDIIAWKAASRDLFEKGVYEYHAGNFEAAQRSFDLIPRSAKLDMPVEIYRRRCRQALGQRS